MQKLLGRLKAEGKIGEGLSPHRLRHRVAIDLRELGFDERQIADDLGLAEIETVRGYARGADLRKQMQIMVDRLAGTVEDHKTGRARKS